MNSGRCLIVLAAAAFVACAGAAPPKRLSTAEALTVTNSVREFAATVADGVTRRGPQAWRDYFVDSPAFFMASEGRLVFENGDAATRGVQELTRSITHIELRWGEGLRVDPLSPTLAIMAAPWHELRVDAGGHRVEENGYFTALVEFSSLGWRFRDAHWSVTAAPSAVP